MSLIGCFLAARAISMSDLNSAISFPFWRKLPEPRRFGLKPEWRFAAIQFRPFNTAIATQGDCHNFETFVVVKAYLQLYRRNLNGGEPMYDLEIAMTIALAIAMVSIAAFV
jgi:hypothetical protein